MDYKIPINDLYKYSFKFSLFIMLTAFVSIYVMEGNYRLVVFRTLMAFFHFYITFIINIQLYRYFIRKDKKLHFRVKFLIGYLLTIGLFSLTVVFTQKLIEFNILSDEMNRGPIEEIYTTWRIFVFVPFLAFVIYFTVHFFHTFIILLYNSRQAELELIRLQSANMETTNELLKQQIQPHFLFNALNTLKSLIKKKPDVAEDYLIQLSDFLRASLSSNKRDVVTLEEELKLCENYMQMQETRFGEALKYEVEIPLNYYSEYHLPMFSLQPLLENAIKHNELTKQSPLMIHIRVEQDTIIVENNLKLKKFVEVSTKNGLSNLRERYRILFQEEIEIVQTEHHFIVKLKLIPNESNHH